MPLCTSLGPAALLLIVALLPSPANAQVVEADSVVVLEGFVPAETEARTPEGALWRAVVLPSWGQFYNGQGYKAPFVYAGLATFAGSAIFNNSRYRRYRHAYLYGVAPEQYPQYAEAASRYSSLIAAGEVERLRTARDYHRRNRDLSYFGIGLWYALSALDAYVSAHLLDFDVVDAPLSIQLHPTPEGPGVRLSLTLP